MNEPQTVFGKWIFPSVMLLAAVVLAAGVFAALAIELRGMKEAEAEIKWRHTQLITPD